MSLYKHLEALVAHLADGDGLRGGEGGHSTADVISEHCRMLLLEDVPVGLIYC